jgi:hypothetical protein
MDGGKPIGQDAGTSGTVMSIDGLPAEAHSTNAFCPQVDTGQVGIGIVEGAADEHDSERPSRNDGDDARRPVDAGRNRGSLRRRCQGSRAGNPEASEVRTESG